MKTSLNNSRMCLRGSVVLCLWWRGGGGGAVIKQGGAGKGAERGSQKSFEYGAKIWSIISLALLKVSVVETLNFEIILG